MRPLPRAIFRISAKGPGRPLDLILRYPRDLAPSIDGVLARLLLRIIQDRANPHRLPVVVSLVDPPRLDVRTSSRASARCIAETRRHSPRNGSASLRNSLLRPSLGLLEGDSAIRTRVADREDVGDSRPRRCSTDWSRALFSENQAASLLTGSLPLKNATTPSATHPCDDAPHRCPSREHPR
jgi:hypothetical protein